MIEFKNVSKVYDNNVKALSDVNVEIASGEFVFLVGPSGAGKSTFIKMLLKEVDFRLIPNLNVYENVAFAMKVVEAAPKEIRRRVPMVLSLVGLSHKYKMFPHELSGGEQQRVSLARAIVNNPSILIADEPTGNLDPDTAKEIMELLDDINKAGTTVLMATHAQEIVNDMKKRVIAIEKGEIVRDEKRGRYNDEN